MMSWVLYIVLGIMSAGVVRGAMPFVTSKFACIFLIALFSFGAVALYILWGGADKI